MMDEIQGAHTPADIWQVEKKISCLYFPMRGPRPTVPSSSNTTPCPDRLMGKDGLGDGSSKIVDAEEDFQKSISTLISTMITEGAKIPGEHGMALTSSIFCLVPTLPLDLGTSTKHRFTTGERV